MVTPIVDAHIDLAWNMSKGRDPRVPAAETRRIEAKDAQKCMVSLPEWRAGDPPVPVSRVREVLALMADAAGWDHVVIGSDLDGGIGLDESPDGIDCIGCIGKIGDVVPANAKAGVLGENWIRFLRRALPS